jgi:hypothetical protein
VDDKLNDNDFESGTLALVEYLSEYRTHYFAWLSFIDSDWRKRLSRWKIERLIIHKHIVEAMRKVLIFDRHGRLDYKTQAGKAAVRRFIKDGGILDKWLTIAVEKAHDIFGIEVKRNTIGLITKAGLQKDEEDYILSEYKKAMKP